MSRKGFVLVETIAVITVLCIVLVLLYGSYSNIIKNVESKSVYDNTEYIYKTALIRDFILNNKPISLYDYNITYCQNSSSNKCYYDSCTTEKCKLFNFMGVEAVYITPWDTSSIAKELSTSNIEATTQKYINYIDAPAITGNAERLIVMFKDENDDSNEKTYQYASIKIER